MKDEGRRKSLLGKEHRRENKHMNATLCHQGQIGLHELCVRYRCTQKRQSVLFFTPSHYNWLMPIRLQYYKAQGLTDDIRPNEEPLI